MSALRPCTVGLTGGLASGKSAVARLLIGHGAAVLDADAVVHKLYMPGGDGARAVAELFGPDFLNAAGAVDRERLGQQVLGDKEALERLNQAIHPLVRARVGRWIESVTSPVAMVEAALLVETGAYRNYDLLALVWCHPSQQLERAQARGMDERRARQVLAAQASMEAKRKTAHVLIDNSGPVDQLAAEVARAWREILRLCGERSSA